MKEPRVARTKLSTWTTWHVVRRPGRRQVGRGTPEPLVRETLVETMSDLRWGQWSSKRESPAFRRGECQLPQDTACRLAVLISLLVASGETGSLASSQAVPPPAAMVE